MAEFLLKFPLFYLANEEIQNNIYIFFNIPTTFYAEFPRSQDKRAGISKDFLSLSTLFLYIRWVRYLVTYC